VAISNGTMLVITSATTPPSTLARVRGRQKTSVAETPVMNANRSSPGEWCSGSA
jgi:hypothetical protein